MIYLSPPIPSSSPTLTRHVLLLSPSLTQSSVAPSAPWDWLRLDAQGHISAQGSERADAIERQPATVLVWPAAALSWQRVRLPKLKGSKLRAALDGLLEDRLLDDAAQMHYALAPGYASSRSAEVWVACCLREPLQQALAQLEASGHRIGRIVPALAPALAAAPAAPPLWLHGSADHAALLAQSEHGCLHWTIEPQHEPGPSEREQLGRWLATLGLPAHTPALASPAAVALAERWLPERAWSASREQHPWLQAHASGWDLAQFDLSLQGSAARWRVGLDLLRQGWSSPAWRPLRWGLAGLAALQLLGLNLSAWQAQQRIADLRAHSQQTLRSHFPQVQLVLDAPLQMQREVERLRQTQGELGPADLEPLLEQLGRIQQQTPFELRQLRFAANSVELGHAPLSPAVQATLEQNLAAARWQWQAQSPESSLLSPGGRQP